MWRAIQGCGWDPLTHLVRNVAPALPSAALFSEVDAGQNKALSEQCPPHCPLTAPSLPHSLSAPSWLLLPADFILHPLQLQPQIPYLPEITRTTNTLSTHFTPATATNFLTIGDFALHPDNSCTSDYGCTYTRTCTGPPRSLSAGLVQRSATSHSSVPFGGRQLARSQPSRPAQEWGVTRAGKHQLQDG